MNQEKQKGKKFALQGTSGKVYLKMGKACGLNICSDQEKEENLTQRRKVRISKKNRFHSLLGGLA